MQFFDYCSLRIALNYMNWMTTDQSNRQTCLEKDTRCQRDKHKVLVSMTRTVHCCEAYDWQIETCLLICFCFYWYPGYSWDMVHSMEEMCRTLQHPVTFPVRAALLAQSFSQLKWLLQQSDRWPHTHCLFTTALKHWPVLPCYEGDIWFCLVLLHFGKVSMGSR